MKPRPKDLLDTLTTGEDRVALANECKAALRAFKLKVRVQRRKLATGEKYFFHVEGDMSNNEHVHMWGGPFRNIAHGIVKQRFPQARVTSAGTDNCIIAEY